MNRTIIIGDVHGCYYTLQALLEKLRFSPGTDCLYFLGDVIGKGKHSDKVLDFLMDTPVCKTVLGNHDVSWLRSYALQQFDREDFQQLSQSSSADRWFQYLIKMPFLIRINAVYLVHASLYPSWYGDDALEISHWLSRQLQSDPKLFFESMQRPPVLKWSKDLSDSEKRYLALQILTRCRYYKPSEEMDIDSVGEPEAQRGLTPWYEKPRNIKEPIYFGHWASLKGRVLGKDCTLDGGAVYGGHLLAIDLDSKESWQQKRVSKDEP